MKGPEAHLPGFAIAGEAEHPRFRPGGSHLQPQPAPVAVVTRRLELGYTERRQLRDLASHPSLPTLPMALPMFIARIVANAYERMHTESGDLQRVLID